MNELRKKLFEIFLNSVIKEAQKISKVRASPQDAFDEAIYDLEPFEWTQLHTRWKAKLKRLGITRTTCKYLRSTHFMDEPRTNSVATLLWLKGKGYKIWVNAGNRNQSQGSLARITLPGRNIPGFYSIVDPITTSERARTICFIDLPTELGDKILVLGELPT